MAEDTRKNIIEAAISLFAQNGYSRTAVSDIVKKVGVTKPVLYYYFGSKEGLYKEIFRSCFEGFEEMFRKTFEGVSELEDFVSVFVRFDLEMIAQYREIISVLFSEFYSLRSHLPVESMLELADRHHALISDVLCRCLKGENTREDIEEVVRMLDGMLCYYEIGILKFECELKDEDYARLSSMIFKMIKAVVS